MSLRTRLRQQTASAVAIWPADPARPLLRLAYIPVTNGRIHLERGRSRNIYALPLPVSISHFLVGTAVPDGLTPWALSLSQSKMPDVRCWVAKDFGDSKICRLALFLQMIEPL